MSDFNNARLDLEAAINDWADEYSEHLVRYPEDFAAKAVELIYGELLGCEPISANSPQQRCSNE